MTFFKSSLSGLPLPLQVRVLDVENETVTTEDVLVLGTDGLWDVVRESRPDFCKFQCCHLLWGRNV